MAVQMNERITRFGATWHARPSGFPGWQRIVSVERADPNGDDEEASP